MSLSIVQNLISIKTGHLDLEKTSRKHLKDIEALVRLTANNIGMQIHTRAKKRKLGGGRKVLASRDKILRRKGEQLQWKGVYYLSHKHCLPACALPNSHSRRSALRASRGNVIKTSRGRRPALFTGTVRNLRFLDALLSRKKKNLLKELTPR